MAGQPPAHAHAGQPPVRADGPVTPEEVRRQTAECLADLQAAAGLGPGKVLVVGASTSEIAGERIGTATSAVLGQAVVDAVLAFAEETGCDVVFQCCEHLNRALVARADAVERHGWREVTAVPVPGAGGAVAAAAYFTWPDARLVEAVAADAGIDIGDTLIGMHLRRVAVPVRGRRREIGRAHVTMARTRPPLVGGARAVYDRAAAAARWAAALALEDARPDGAAEEAGAAGARTAGERAGEQPGGAARAVGPNEGGCP